MRRPLAACAAALCAALSPGCGGGPPGDLFVVQRSGSIPGASLRLRVTDDGGAYCNSIGRREITSQQLLDAREIRRELNGEKPEDVAPADRGLRLAPGPGSVLSYRVRSEDGTVAFSDTSRGQPPVFFRIAKLTRDVARGSCGLAR
jgi:hypothetical protein